MSEAFEPNVTPLLANKPHTALMLDNIFCDILRKYFSDPENISLASLKNRIWNEDVQQTRIHIEPAYKWNPRMADEYPAILSRRGDLKQQTLGLYKGAIEETQGKVVHIHKLWGGGHSFLCISTNPYEAEQLAFEVVGMFSDYKLHILKALGLTSFDVLGISALNLINDTAVATYGIDVQCQYAFSDSKRIEMTKQ